MLYGTINNTDYGFYLDTDKNNLKSSVEVSAADYTALLEGQANGKIITHDENGKPFLKEYEITAADKQQQYKTRVVELIRQKYSVNDEYGVLNKGIADASDADYVAYRAYVAECKAKAKTEGV
jgi:hypothetical protein